VPQRELPPRKRGSGASVPAWGLSRRGANIGGVAAANTVCGRAEWSREGEDEVTGAGQERVQRWRRTASALELNSRCATPRFLSAPKFLCCAHAHAHVRSQHMRVVSCHAAHNDVWGGDEKQLISCRLLPLRSYKERAFKI
jgi:hypothetical protein